jgi:hypothetical protein
MIIPVQIKFIFSLLLIIAACSDKQSTSQNPEYDYFNLEEYFIKEAEALRKRNALISKTLLKDGITETLVFDSVQWDKELKPFMNSDLNKPAFRQAYSVDTVHLNSATKIIYSAQDPSLTTRSILISHHNGIIYSVMIINQTSNVYYSTAETLIYLPGRHYIITMMNDPAAGKETSFQLQGEIINR